MKRKEAIEKLIKDYDYTQKEAEGELNFYINERKRSERNRKIAEIKESVYIDEEMPVEVKIK